MECASFSGLLMDFAREKGSPLHHQGAPGRFRFRIRVADGPDEPGALAGCGDRIPDPGCHLSFLSASLVREVAAWGGTCRPSFLPR